MSQVWPDVTQIQQCELVTHIEVDLACNLANMALIFSLSIMHVEAVSFAWEGPELEVGR